MKKLALMLTLVLVFTVSCVFATETAMPISGETDNAVISGEIADSEIDSGEIVEAVESGDENEEVLPESGNAIDENEPTTDISSDEADDVTTTDSDKGAVVGAIIAIAIVVIVVAIAAILRKD